jgi:hypothetical protein
MIKTHKNLKLTITIIVLVVTLLIVGGIAALQNRATDSNSTDTPAPTTETPAEESPESEEKPQEEAPETEPSVAPEDTSSIDIEPMDLTVYYVRGIPGFEFVVERTESGTQYVQFRSPDLKGTKCTDDEGAFASIITNPSTTEAQSLTATTTVGDDTYGLSLTDATCTKDEQLLEQYQDSFSQAFSLLSRISTDN